MALTVNITADPLSIVVSAYVRIEQLSHNRFEGDMECVARCYQSQPGFPPTMPAFKDLTFRAPLNPDGGNPYAQAYVGAKVLPEFAGAIDC